MKSFNAETQSTQSTQRTVEKEAKVISSPRLALRSLRLCVEGFLILRG